MAPEGTYADNLSYVDVIKRRGSQLHWYRNVCNAVNYSQSTPSFSGNIAAQTGGPGKTAGGMAIAYQYVQFDAEGSGRAEFTYSGNRAGCAIIYQKSTREMPPLPEPVEETISDGPIGADATTGGRMSVNKTLPVPFRRCSSTSARTARSEQMTATCVTSLRWHRLFDGSAQ